MAKWVRYGRSEGKNAASINSHNATKCNSGTGLQRGLNDKDRLFQTKGWRVWKVRSPSARTNGAQAAEQRSNKSSGLFVRGAIAYLCKFPTILPPTLLSTRIDPVGRALARRTRLKPQASSTGNWASFSHTQLTQLQVPLAGAQAAALLGPSHPLSDGDLR
jgi:hypothetical protein